MKFPNEIKSEKVSIAMKDYHRNLSPEKKEKLSVRMRELSLGKDWARGHIVTKEHREKMSAKMKEYHASRTLEQRKAHSAKMHMMKARKNSSEPT